MKAILIGITTKNDYYDINYSLDELENLAETLDIECVHRVTQSLDKPNSRTYLGSGKLAEAAIAVHAFDIELAIINDELSPSQLRNVQDELKIEVIDRSYLILKIFEMRAQTRESKLEIKLAKDLYLLPRIQFMREKADRIGGGGQTKGAGETQKELDRRHLEAEIAHITEDLKSIRQRKMLAIEKRKRNDLPIVALVGYTNAGKSSTMNTLLEEIGQTQKHVYAKDELFATLATFNRKITYKKVDFMLVDTIGFVSKLPHSLVNSFFETLQEIKNADLIIHVVDSSSKYINEQLSVVMNTLETLNAGAIPSIFLLNKWDSTIDETMHIPSKKTIQFSNKTKLNINLLLDNILEEIAPQTFHTVCLIPYREGKLVNMIEEKCTIYKKEYQEYGVYFDIEVPSKLYSQISMYDLDTMIS